MVSLGLIGLGLTRGGWGFAPPAGFIFLVDDDGAYLVDSDGAYLVEAL